MCFNPSPSSPSSPSPPTQDWSISADKDNLGIDWHVPSLEELSLVDRILAEFLEPELDTLRAFMGGEELER